MPALDGEFLSEYLHHAQRKYVKEEMVYLIFKFQAQYVETKSATNK